ncbi:hypothetical protein OROGR_026004 [Orobanche gracilis]
MEVFPSIKTQYSKSPFLYRPCCSIDSKRKLNFTAEANSVSCNCFRHVNGLRLILRCSYGDGGLIIQPGRKYAAFSGIEAHFQRNPIQSGRRRSSTARRISRRFMI